MIEFDIKAGRSDVIEIRVPRERLAEALIGSASETSPIVLHEAWGNGDSAEVIVRRIPWRRLDWRQTAQGWIRGPYRIWCDDQNMHNVTCGSIPIGHQRYEALVDAKEAAERHMISYRAEVP